MANRSYLYSTNLPSNAAPDQGARRITGISEWNYDIPLVFKILLSGNPRTCPSLIWNSDDNIALAGDYIAGAEKLLLFCDAIGHPNLLPLAREAGEFLVEARNKDRYFHLECAEIFFLSHEDGFDALASGLVEEIKGIDQQLDEIKQAVSQDPERSEDVFRAWGLGYWSNILYFDLNTN